jgi:GT2 family glycosyltransferase
VVLQIDAAQALHQPWTVKLHLANGRHSAVPATPRFLPDLAARDLMLGYIASVEHYGNRDVETFIALEGGAGTDLVAFNRRISADIVAHPHVVHHGPKRRHFRASLVICLYGRPEFMFLQGALFHPAPGAEEYEYIYVSNSPELSEQLDREARICARIYGLSLVVVTLPGNAGFSAANNAAARFARSERIVIINPDVFPRDAGWAARHSAIVEQCPKEQTALFGASLYYNDGSLMHGGMYFEVDRGLSIRAQAITTRAMLRVEHYGKGAPASSGRYARPRPVPAVTGAFMSIDRAWFEALGGFSEDYLFGHYEDADLCLRSLAGGRPAWLQDIHFWHMEGKGSTRLPPHEGGSLVNRWWFSRQWSETIDAGLTGPEPQLSLLAPPPMAERPPGLPAPTTPIQSATQGCGRKPRRGNA